MSNEVLLASIAAVLTLVWFFRRLDMVSTVQAKKLVAEGAKLVDVRTPVEFASSHIAGAINIPVSEFGERAPELGPNKQQPVILYCRSGARSARGKRLLKANGFTEVHNLGPMSRWR